MAETPRQTNDLVQEIINRYSQLIYRLAYVRTGNRHDADDIYQEVFLRYVKACPSFRSEEHGKAWFIRVTANISNNLLKSAWRRKTVGIEDNAGYMDNIPIEEYSDLKAALMHLPAVSLTVIHLYYFENMKADDIAKTLHMPSSSVRVQLSRTRKKLKTYLTVEEAQARV